MYCENVDISTVFFFSFVLFLSVQGSTLTVSLSSPGTRTISKCFCTSVTLQCLVFCFLLFISITLIMLSFRPSETDADLDSAVQLSCHKAVLCAR